MPSALRLQVGSYVALSLFGDLVVSCSKRPELSTKAGYMRFGSSPSQPLQFIAHRFKDIIGKAAFKKGGYWLLRFDLCMSSWLKISRPRTDGVCVADLSHGQNSLWDLIDLVDPISISLSALPTPPYQEF